MTAMAERLAVGQLTQLAERRARELYGPALVALARRGKVPNVALGHLAVRVLLFLLGQRPGYFAHQKVIAAAVESNLTSARGALAELRDAGLVSWELIPPHHPLPTGNYSRTNVNRYYVEAAVLLAALDAGDAATPPKTVAPTHPNSGASTGTDLRSELDPPLPPTTVEAPRSESRAVDGQSVSKVRERDRATLLPDRTSRPFGNRPKRNAKRTDDVERVLAAWRKLQLGEVDDRSARALENRLSEGTTVDDLMQAIAGARRDEWLRQGRAESPFAVVFASRESIARFVTAGREHAHRDAAEAQLRATERAACSCRDDVAPLSPAENARLAELALTVLCGTVG